MGRRSSCWMSFTLKCEERRRWSSVIGQHHICSLTGGPKRVAWLFSRTFVLPLLRELELLRTTNDERRFFITPCSNPTAHSDTSSHPRKLPMSSDRRRLLPHRLP